MLQNPFQFLFSQLFNMIFSRFEQTSSSLKPFLLLQLKLDISATLYLPFLICVRKEGKKMHWCGLRSTWYIILATTFFFISDLLNFPRRQISDGVDFSCNPSDSLLTNVSLLFVSNEREQRREAVVKAGERRRKDYEILWHWWLLPSMAKFYTFQSSSLAFFKCKEHFIIIYQKVTNIKSNISPRRLDLGPPCGLLDQISQVSDSPLSSSWPAAQQSS